MKKTEITIIGCGATGLAAAVWYEIQGLSVTLCDTKEQFTELELIEKQGGIFTEGAFGLTYPIPVHKMTTRIKEAVKGKKYILVCVSAKRQEEVIKIIAPVLEAGQAVLFSPGNLGAVCLQKELDMIYQAKEKPKIISAELSGNLWACRIKEAGRVIVALPLTVQKMAAYPSGDTAKAVEFFKPLLPAEPAKNVAEAMLNSPNLITHLAGTLLNMCEIERKKEDFALFEDGLSESIIFIFKALEQERNAVLSAYGLNLYKKESSEVLMRKLMQKDTPQELLIFKALKGPSSMKHRYISEDAPCGTALMVSMAMKAGVEVPVAKSLLTLASAVNRTDYYECGRTLYSMNFSEKELKG